jgi:hypothetical protein
MNQPQKSLLSLLSFTIATTLILSYNPPANVVLASPQIQTKATINLPTLEETKAIAEAGFIYGLPIVMNCGSVWCSNVYLLKGDTRLKTALEERTILTPELTPTAIGDPSEPSQAIAQRAEQRAELVQRVFAQTVKQVLSRQTLSIAAS